MVSWLGYGIAVFAPGVYSPDVGTYEVAHNIIRSHVKAYHTYDDHFRARYNGILDILSLMLTVSMIQFSVKRGYHE